MSVNRPTEAENQLKTDEIGADIANSCRLEDLLIFAS